MFTTNDVFVSQKISPYYGTASATSEKGGGVKRLMRHYTLVVGDIVNISCFFLK